MRNPFLNALPIIANALADTLGVEVVMNAGNPRTNGKKIFLPALDGENADSRSLAMGYISHEGGHCRFTDFGLLQELSTPLESHINNILEDVYVERMMADKYPGTRIYLKGKVETLVKMKFLEPSSATLPPVKLMQTYMLFRLFADVLEVEAIEDFADIAEEQLREIIPVGTMTKLEALMFRVEECKNSQDVLDLTRAIIKMMEDEAKQEEENERQQEEDDQQQGQTDSSQPEDDSEQDESQANSSSSEQDGEEGKDEQQQSGNGNGPKASEILQSILSAGEDEAIKTTDEALEEALGTVQEPHAASNVVPFRTQSYTPRNAHVDIDSEKNRVSGVSNALRVRAQSLMQAQTQAVKRNTMTGTKLNVKNLHRAKIDGQVFQKTKEGIKIDTAMALLVDRSISMSSRIDLAMDAVLATTMAFDRPGVKTAAFAFPFRDGEESNVLLKHWDAQPASSIPALKSIWVDGTTPMAEAIMGVGYDLMKRPEARKVMLVVTDGDPDNRSTTQWVIDLARRSGIEVLGIAIYSDAVRVFGSQWAQNIQSLDELPVAMIGMLEANIFNIARR